MAATARQHALPGDARRCRCGATETRGSFGSGRPRESRFSALASVDASNSGRNRFFTRVATAFHRGVIARIAILTQLRRACYFYLQTKAGHAMRYRKSTTPVGMKHVGPSRRAVGFHITRAMRGESNDQPVGRRRGRRHARVCGRRAGVSGVGRAFDPGAGAGRDQRSQAQSVRQFDDWFDQRWRHLPS